ncbi:hypothetical protein NEIMUCOT_04091 [Neisseria mucosa ATCC 25996]|uniref:Uncharacterized protein n=1 Tax=Neisseria mucosa (strain ATCC 25996 / DSM 4631 / NCTC 10774 / M26) TaxID=546266 RepID=D2ZU03_NEIM2|nr:hypothetical protein NEIMUCOT_04091 [Neisseria mucosa ATCC 25996]
MAQKAYVAAAVEFAGIARHSEIVAVFFQPAEQFVRRNAAFKHRNQMDELEGIPYFQ